MTDQYKPGANWTSKDGKRNIVITHEGLQGRGKWFAIRNLATGMTRYIELSGLDRKFRFTGYDPAFKEQEQQ